ncbi:MAG: transporter substrate-binding domain-containing protein [Kiritimatiellia bacterium]
MRWQPVILLCLFAGMLIPRPGLGDDRILSGCEFDYPPFGDIGISGHAEGFSVELLRESLAEMDQDVSFKAAPWCDLKEDLAAGRLHVLPLVARTPERERMFDFTFPYLTLHGTIVVRKDNTGIQGAADLRGKKVAVLEEDFAHDYLRQSNWGALIEPVPSFAVALRELSEGKHDAVVMMKLLAFHLMNDEGLTKLKTVDSNLPGYSQSLCFAVRKGDTRLLGLLNEGLSIVMANGTFRRLHAKWIASSQSLGQKKSRLVVGGDARYPPYEYTDRNGEPAGFNVDLTRAIARQMGLTVDIRLTRWSDMREALNRGEIDIVQGMFYSHERDRKYDFSPPHTIVHHVIVVREGSAEFSDLASLKGKTILVQGDDIMHELAIEKGLGKQLTVTPTQEEALRRLAAGEGDCALVAKVHALYWIRKKRWDNLNVSAASILSPDYCYAAPHGNEALLAEFSEGLAAIKNTGEYRAIQTKWLAPFDHSRGFWTFVKVSLWIALPLLTLLVGTLAWSHSLRTRVIRRTQELERETEASKKMARELQNTVENLARSNNELEQFANITSHDLKEPLRMVTGFMSLLKEHAEGRLDAKADKYIGLAAEGSMRMQRLVDDLLAYSRVGRERSMTAVDSAVSLDEALKNLNRAIEESGAIITRDPLPVVRGNITEMTQLFQNLVGNALKFRDGRPPQIHVGCGREDDAWHFYVRDNGIGIEPQYLERIFLIFQRLHTEEKYPGTGIGLAICKKTVENHGGRIWVESVPNQGSTFHFTLPAS